MAHVREVPRAGGVAHEVRWKVNGKFKQRTFTAKREAERFALRIENELADGSSTEALVRNAKTFAELAVATQAASATRTKTKTQLGDDSNYRIHILPVFGARRINTITSIEIEVWLTDMRTKMSKRTKKPLSASSIHGAYISLSKVFAYAVKHRLIATNPCAVVDKPRVAKEERGFLDSSQVNALATKLDAYAPYGLIVRFAAYTGLREGELAALRIRDVNLLHRRVEVRRTVHRVKGGWEVGTPKSVRSTRDVPLGRSLIGELSEYLSQHPRRNEPEAPLWPGRVPGGNGDVRTLDYDRQFDVASLIRYYFKPALADLGIAGARWHDLRHYYASVCAAAGIEIRKVSRWMGHANINTTDSIYTHLFNGTHDEDMDRLDAAAKAATNVASLHAIG
ncbi:tyrosine-type recombinase/integrase [Microbacterium sp. 22179]|uniref:tyrosine-type recombinase/integrase n=1 Tax=Microbacterium sp. 22179 TaxID=3453886 RepID=UPI003F843345